MRRHRRGEERRLRAYARTGVDAVVQPDTDDEAVARAGAAGAGPRLAGALARLRPADRDVLLLFAWAGLGYAEIAQALRVPVGTVRSRLHRVRTQLREELGPAPDPGSVLDLDATVEMKR